VILSYLEYIGYLTEQMLAKDSYSVAAALA
jgi:hypothetical protein